MGDAEYTDYGIPAGDYSTADAAPDASGDHNNFWDFGTALLDTAGNVISLLDSNGNPVDDASDVTADQGAMPPKQDNTMMIILGVIAAMVVILIVFIILKKKK